MCDFHVHVYTSISGGTTAVMTWSEGTFAAPRQVSLDLARVEWGGRMTRQEHGLWCLHQLVGQFYKGTRPARLRDSASPGINDNPGDPPEVSGIAIH